MRMLRVELDNGTGCGSCDILVGNVDQVDFHLQEGENTTSADVNMTPEQLLEYVDWLEIVINADDPLKVGSFFSVGQRRWCADLREPKIVSHVIFHPDSSQHDRTLQYSVILSGHDDGVPVMFELHEDDIKDFISTVRLLNGDKKIVNRKMGKEKNNGE
jgi:hypothetical protein